MACDINDEAIKGANRQFGATIVSPDEIYDVDCDIFSPCALGGVINKDTIPRLKARVIAGGANNQLAEDDCAQMLADRRILYARLRANAERNSTCVGVGRHGAEWAKARIARYTKPWNRCSPMPRQTACTAAADRMVEERIPVRRSKRFTAGADLQADSACFLTILRGDHTR